ncbi:MAG TPA: ABC transporter substrate-binding protein [Pseudomonadales bacterium]|nr:ABC transporter substrate-binding protein [Pseudomonadales bacterium]
MKAVILATLLLCCATVSWAAEDPSALVRNTAEQVRTVLLKENGSNTDAVRSEVEQLVLPRFDFTRMTALAVGKNWRQATDQQKSALTTEFRILLTRTYFSTMLRYRDAKISIKPDTLLENEGKEATVKSQVQVASNNAPVAIDYVLYNTAEGWKFFNVIVEGASLVTVYRNQFGDEVSKGGIDGLIQSLHTKNLAPAPQSANAAAAPVKS